MTTKTQHDSLRSVKEWLTPMLISATSYILWSQLSDIKSDVKNLLITQSGMQVKVNMLENDINLIKKTNSDYNYGSFPIRDREKPIAKKEDEIKIPTGEKTCQ